MDWIFHYADYGLISLLHKIYPTLHAFHPIVEGNRQWKNIIQQIT